MAGHGPVVRVGGSLTNVERPAQLALTVHDRVAAWPACRCDRNADSGSVPCVTRHGTARTTTDRSSRATRASPDRRGTLPPANPRSVAATSATRASPPPPHATADTPPASTVSDDASARPRPVRATRPIPPSATVRRDLARHRRRRPTQPPRDRPQRLTTRETPRDLLTLSQRQPQRRPHRLPHRRTPQPRDIAPHRAVRAADLLADQPTRQPQRRQPRDLLLLPLRQPLHTAPPDRSSQLDRRCRCDDPLRPPQI